VETAPALLGMLGVLARPNLLISDRPRLHHAVHGRRRITADHLKPCAPEQFSVFSKAALAAAGGDHHGYIQRPAEMGTTVVGQHSFDNRYPAIGANRAADGA